MKQLLLLGLYCMVLPWQGLCQSIVKFETGGLAYYCTSFVYHNNINGLAISNSNTAMCNNTTLQLQISDFTGVGTYSLAYGHDNYGFFNPTPSPPAMQTPTYPDDPGGGTITVTRYDSALGILEGYFNMGVSNHAFDTSDHNVTTISNGYFSFGTCFAVFNVAPDTIPHHWWVYYRFNGPPPVTVTFDWGDGSSTTGNASHTYAAAGSYNICLSVTDNAGCTATYCDASTYIYKAEETVSMSPLDLLATDIIQPKGEEAWFKIYPNPASGSSQLLLNRSFTETSAVVTDFAGRRMAGVSVNGRTVELQPVNLPAGLYLICIGNFTGKLVITGNQ